MSGITSRNAAQDTSLIKPFHPRKSHLKSRGGCDACKRRKKKCDELIPTCSGCSKLKVLCHYDDARLSRVGRKNAIQPPASTVVTHHGLPTLKPDEIELLHHFQSQTLGTIGSLSVQEVVTGCLAAAFEFDFLRYTIFALAASHLMFLSEHHNMSREHHLQRALHTFRQRLSSPISAAHVDAVLTSCVLLDTVAFSKDSHEPSDSWLFTDSSNLQWLTVQMGIRTIMSNIRHLLMESSWTAVYKKDAAYLCGKTSASFDDDYLGSENIPENLEYYFTIKSRPSFCNNPYYSILRSLLPLLVKNSLDNSLTHLMAVAHRFIPEFYRSIKSKDLRALLLLAYWLGLMCNVHLWWISSRATSECYACCRYIEMRGDDIICGLLSFPARCCGYNLGHEK